MATYNLKEIANEHAKKAPEMVDNLTEKTPILERVPWEKASHNLWNMAERINDIDGPGWVDADAALPTIDMSTDLVKTDLTILGGEMEQARDTVDQFGGPAKYFAKKEPLILKQAGMDTEKKLYYDNWKAWAIANSQTTNCGASSGGVYSMLIVRFEKGNNCGLFDPTGFVNGTLLRRELINNGAEYHLRSKSGVLGYGVALRGRFGWQNLGDSNQPTIHALLNINATNIPTENEIDEALIKARASEYDTMIMCHPACAALSLRSYKSSALQMNVEDKKYDRRIMTWNGVPVVTSYNLYYGTETVTSFS